MASAPGSGANRAFGSGAWLYSDPYPRTTAAGNPGRGHWKM